MLTGVRMLMLSQPALSEMEQQLLRYAHQPDVWHPGMGPLLPWLVKASTSAFGEGGFGVRFFAPLLMLGAGWLLWESVRGLFDATTASWSLLIFQVTPAVNVAAVTMTLTTAGIAASVGILAALRLALHRDHRFHLQWWLLGGALILAFLVDWRLMMLGLSVGASMGITSRGRRALMKWPVLPVLAGCLGLVLTIFLAWNSEHAWSAFGPLPQSEPRTFWQSLVILPLAFSPLLLVAFGWALVRSVLRRPMDYAVSFLYAFTWPLVTLDILIWSTLPWPHCGVSTWLAPVIALLAHHSLHAEETRPRILLLARSATIFAASLQSCWMMHGGLQQVLGLGW